MTATPLPDTPRAWTVFLAFLRLGLTAFGGPAAHLGLFRDEFVGRRRWLGDAAYAECVALCQFLPGPASSQVGFALGLMRAGWRGGLAAWAGFTLPSAVLMALLGLGVASQADLLPAALLQGLMLAAVAVVALAVWTLGRSLCPDAPRLALMLLSALAVWLWPGPWVQVAVMAVAALAGALLLPVPASAPSEALFVRISRRAGVACLFAYLALLAGLPCLLTAFPGVWLTIVDVFYRAGALVFGGGHVVLPLLQAEIVPAGWLDTERFLAGYGAAQAVPGPIFTFAAYLGAAAWGVPGAVIALLAIFLPGCLLVAGALPFWQHLRQAPRARAMLAGVNAAVVGLLLAALAQAITHVGVFGIKEGVLVLAAALALLARIPAWLVVPASGILAWLLADVF